MSIHDRKSAIDDMSKLSYLFRAIVFTSKEEILPRVYSKGEKK